MITTVSQFKTPGPYGGRYVTRDVDRFEINRQRVAHLTFGITWVNEVERQGQGRLHGFVHLHRSEGVGRATRR